MAAGEMLLINPRKRRKAARSGVKRRRTAVRRRRNPIATRKVLRARPPMTISRHRRSRRRNPIALRRAVTRRRRNPIGRVAGGNGMNVKNFIAMFKEAAVGGAGGVVFDMLMGQINGYLPASMQTVRGQVSTGDAVKAVITAFVGQGLNRMTKGWSKRLAMGSLTVQAYDLIGVLVPDAMTVGFASPARIVNGSARVGPTRGGMLQAYVPAGRGALLNGAGGGYARQNSGQQLSAYVRPGPGALLNGANAQRREGVTLFK